MRPFCVEDPLREEQFRTQLPKLRQLTTIPHRRRRGMGHARGIQPARREPRHRLRARVAAERRRHHRDAQDHGAVRHAQGRHRAALHAADRHGRPHAHDDGVPRPGADGIQPTANGSPDYLPEFLECRNGKVWPNDRPGLGVTVDEKQLTFVEEFTTAAPGPTYRRPDGSLSHW